MDYKTRNYYLVTLDNYSHNMRLRYFKLAAETLKIHAPYFHIKDNNYTQDYYNNRYWQMMLSCKKEESEALEYELDKAKRRDDNGSNFIKLTKDICGQ